MKVEAGQDRKDEPKGVFLEPIKVTVDTEPTKLLLTSSLYNLIIEIKNLTHDPIEINDVQMISCCGTIQGRTCNLLNKKHSLFSRLNSLAALRFFNQYVQRQDVANDAIGLARPTEPPDWVLERTAVIFRPDVDRTFYALFASEENENPLKAEYLSLYSSIGNDANIRVEPQVSLILKYKVQAPNKLSDYCGRLSFTVDCRLENSHSFVKEIKMSMFFNINPIVAIISSVMGVAMSFLLSILLFWERSQALHYYQSSYIFRFFISSLILGLVYGVSLVQVSTTLFSRRLTNHVFLPFLSAFCAFLIFAYFKN